jgi:ferrous iron transport protein B
MTCSARLPVYTLLIGALYPGVPVVQSGLMLGLYLFSTGMALVAALVLSKTILKAPPAPLVMELPPYRLPRLGDVLRMMWRRTKSFLTDAGTVILGCTIVLWVLLTFPNVTPSKDFDALIQAAPTEELAVELAQEQAAEQLAGSYAGQFGRVIEPTIRPLGFDWKIGVGLIGAFAAREVFVSTMGVVYAVGPDVDEASVSLRDRMAAEKRDDGSPVYTPLTGMSLMIFFALACQCMSTLAAVKRETKSWKWPIFLFVYMTALAWVCSFVVYQGGRLLGLE